MNLSTKNNRKFYNSFCYEQKETLTKGQRKEELDKVIRCISEYYKKEYRGVSVLKYIKEKMVLPYEQVVYDIELLIMAGVLNVEFTEFGESVYVFASEVMDEVESICKKGRFKEDLVK